MLTRQQTIFALTALAGGTVAYTAGSFQRAASRYNEAVRNTLGNRYHGQQSSALNLFRPVQ